ncbi:MAG: hypothetical protein NTY61_03805 [Candidatus Parcubacteria bacterium]|nr:hypothetical protein [Candidatus Parcubacteria bacterium]
MAGKGFLCELRERCGLWDSGCTSEKATAENCMFIGSFEAEKKRAVKALLELLTKNGAIISKDPPYRRLKTSLKYLTPGEFDIALAVATEQYATEKAKRGGRNCYFAR